MAREEEKIKARSAGLERFRAVGVSLIERQQMSAFAGRLIQNAKGFPALALIDQVRDLSSSFVRENGPETDTWLFGADQGRLAGMPQGVMPFNLNAANACSRDDSNVSIEHAHLLSTERVRESIRKTIRTFSDRTVSPLWQTPVAGFNSG